MRCTELNQFLRVFLPTLYVTEATPKPADTDIQLLSAKLLSSYLQNAININQKDNCKSLQMLLVFCN